MFNLIYYSVNFYGTNFITPRHWRANVQLFKHGVQNRINWRRKSQASLNDTISPRRYFCLWMSAFKEPTGEKCCYDVTYKSISKLDFPPGFPALGTDHPRPCPFWNSTENAQSGNPVLISGFVGQMNFEKLNHSKHLTSAFISIYYDIRWTRYKRDPLSLEGMYSIIMQGWYCLRFSGLSFALEATRE